MNGLPHHTFGARLRREENVNGIRVRRTSIILAATMMLYGCGASANGMIAAASVADPRMAAIQTMLDSPKNRNHMAASAVAGIVCQPTTPPQYAMQIDKYVGVPGVTVSPVFIGHQPYDALGNPAKPPYVHEQCRRVTWAASTAPKFEQHGIFGTVLLGHYVVDKVGDEQEVLGTKVTPYRAHFEPTPTGKALVAHRVALMPRDIPDGSAVLHKNADGVLIAE